MNEIALQDRFSQIQIAANRAATVLYELINDYGFRENPSPAKALEISVDCSIEAKQSFQWFAEYGRIYTFIEIASDYVSEIEKLAEGGDDKKSPITNADQSK